MKIIKNEIMINRNAKIGQYTSLGALVVLGLGMYFSFTRRDLFIWTVAALMLGFTLMQISMYFSNRWGRSPRPDEKLDAGLKGLPGDFVLYHWMTPVSHLLVGPAGIWVLLPFHQRGRVTYRKNRWKLSGGGFIQGYMRIFGQESLGRPDVEAEAQIASLRKAFIKEMDEDDIPEIQSALVFTTDGTSIDTEETPIPALPLKKLKDFMRQRAKQRPINMQDLETIKAFLPE